MLINGRIRYGSNTFVFVAVIVGIFVLINFLSTRRFIRTDLTEDKRYTISKSTKNVLSSLDDLVTITAYFSTAPATVAEIRRNVRDILDEYKAFSQKLQIDFVDPANFSNEQKQELRFRGIPELQMNVFEKDKVEIANVYLGISIAYSGKEETLSSVQSTDNLEYELTSTILKVTTKEAKTVGFLAGHDALDINDQKYQGLRGYLDKNLEGQYNITSVSLRDGKGIDDTVTTLVIAGLKQTLTDREKYEIDQFIMRGGSTVFLVDSVKLELERGLQGMPLSTGLNDLLEHYGVKLGNNLLVDRKFHGDAHFRRGFMTVIQPYPYYVKIVKENLSKEHAVTNQLEALTLPWTSSLEVVPKADVTATTLAKTSEFGQSIQGYYNLSPDFRIPDAETQAYPVAAALEGTFKSFYADKEIPPIETDAEGAETVTPAQEGENTETQVAKVESGQARLIVVGTTQLLQYKEGIDFFLNTVDWLTLGDALIGIRSRAITDRPLGDVSELEKFIIKYLCTVGIPVLVVVFGLIRYLLKRRVKQLVRGFKP